MKKSKGQRQGTRSILRRGRHQRGRVNISRIMHDYAEGDRVAIVLDGGQQMGHALQGSRVELVLTVAVEEQISLGRVEGTPGAEHRCSQGSG